MILALTLTLPTWALWLALLDRLDALERERDGLRGPCPVCYEPKQYEEYRICTCCHTHFGYHDAKRSWSELRAEWLAKNVPTS